MSKTPKKPNFSKSQNKWVVWYIHLKTENTCLKTCVKIDVDEKVCGNRCECYLKTENMCLSGCTKRKVS